jgi:hypothetical protein
MVVPHHLAQTAELISQYVQNKHDRRTLVAVGSYGCGRGHVIQEVISTYGFIPVWLYDPTPIGTVDLDGNRLFAVYDIPKVSIPVPRCIVLAESVDSIPAKLKNDCFVVAFPTPPSSAIQAFVKSKGYPVDLATGNPTYADAANAMIVWDASHTKYNRDPIVHATWANFKAGGDQPIEDGLFGYYAGYFLQPTSDDWNLIMGLKRRIPANVHRTVYEAIRLQWAPGVPKFPELLRHKKHAKHEPKEPTEPKTPVSRDYAASIDW